MLISLIATGKQKTLELEVQQLRHDKPLIDKYVGSDAEWVSLLVQGCIWMGLWLWCVTCFIRTIKYSKNPEKTAACFALALCASIPIIALLVDPTVNFTW